MRCFGCSWICSVCVVHRATERRWKSWCLWCRKSVLSRCGDLVLVDESAEAVSAVQSWPLNEYNSWTHLCRAGDKSDSPAPHCDVSVSQALNTVPTVRPTRRSPRTFEATMSFSSGG